MSLKLGELKEIAGENKHFENSKLGTVTMGISSDKGFVPKPSVSAEHANSVQGEMQYNQEDNVNLISVKKNSDQIEMDCNIITNHKQKIGNKVINTIEAKNEVECNSNTHMPLDETGLDYSEQSINENKESDRRRKVQSNLPLSMDKFDMDKCLRDSEIGMDTNEDRGLKMNLFDKDVGSNSDDINDRKGQFSSMTRNTDHKSAESCTNLRFSDIEFETPKNVEETCFNNMRLGEDVALSCAGVINLENNLKLMKRKSGNNYGSTGNMNRGCGFTLSSGIAEHGSCTFASSVGEHRSNEGCSVLGTRDCGSGILRLGRTECGTSTCESRTRERSAGERSSSDQSFRTAADLWSQLPQRVSFVDVDNSSSSVNINSNKQISHQDGYIPPGLERSLVTLSYLASPATSSAPSLSPPAPQHQRFSFRDNARLRRAKITRFYSQDQDNYNKGCELRVLQPLLNVGSSLSCRSGTEGNLGHGRNSLATVWGCPLEPSHRPKLTRNNTTAGVPGNRSSRRRKPSSWEESVSLQRRRSIASREEGREWRDRVLTNTATTTSSVLSQPSLDHKDLRYFFQHPYIRLFATYFTIFCNFLMFAEDPISHSHAESRIPIVGNVFSFVLTKYPPDWQWALVKVLMWITAIVCGLILGKLLVHNILCGRILRLKMFRDEQGSWIAMFLTAIVSLYVFSHVYNILLMVFYNKTHFHIDARMGITYASVMKTCACGTWLGDLITALMVTDVMLQDNLYPDWSPALRKLWRRSNVPRILIFWVGSALATAVVVTVIVFDYISWDRVNRDFGSTELTRAFLASFILVMDLLIMMQDWDFPHFTTTLHINLPGFSVATLEWKYAEVHLTGKWFNYGLIFMVMLIDLNMWKNQIFYYPSKFGQYTGPDDKIRTVLDQELLRSGNASLWTWQSRSQINQTTKMPLYFGDMTMNSRYMGYPLHLKCTAVIPSVIFMIFFVSVISLYGRFPHSQEEESEVNETASRTEVSEPKKDGVSV